MAKKVKEQTEDAVVSSPAGNKMSYNDMFVLKARIEGVRGIPGIKNEGMEQSSFLKLMELLDAMEAKQKIWLKAWNGIFTPYLDKGVEKKQAGGRTTYDFDKTEWKDEINDKLDKLGEESVSLSPLNFLSGTEFFNVAKGRDVKDVRTIRKYLMDPNPPPLKKA